VEQGGGTGGFDRGKEVEHGGEQGRLTIRWLTGWRLEGVNISQAAHLISTCYIWNSLHLCLVADLQP